MGNYTAPHPPRRQRRRPQITSPPAPSPGRSSGTLRVAGKGVGIICGMSEALPRVPDAMDFATAVQNPHALGEQTGLRSATLKLNRQDLPLTYTGKFAVVFQLQTPDQEVWAARFFTTRDHQRSRVERYQTIARALAALPNTIQPLFVGFDYIERGIRITGEWYPMVKMGWAQGTPLGNWVEKNSQEPAALRALAATLEKALEDLQAAGIAHGDWQHDNLLVSNDGQTVRFVDYDGMFVPELSGREAVELGHPNFQHPRRNPSHFNAGLDTFACCSIVVSLRALALAPELISECDNSLLFKKSDYEVLEASAMFARVNALAQRDATLAADLAKLMQLCQSELSISPVVSQKEARWWVPDTARAQPQPSPPASPVPSTLPHVVAPVAQSTPQSSILARFLPWRKPKLTPLDLYRSQMIVIPAGKFIRGSNGASDERPCKEIYLSEYRIGRTPVTVAMWQEYCNATGNTMPSAPSWGWLSDHPMVNVSWDEAQAYADWAGLQLPTEAQWEKAARGKDGREYPWGKDWDTSKCQCSKNKSGDARRTSRVGAYPSGMSPYGVLDMSGNVWEWCADWYDVHNYRSSPDTDPMGPKTGQYHVVRGGSWYYNVTDSFRCAARRRFTPSIRSYGGGFRLSFSPPPTSSPSPLSPPELPPRSYTRWQW